MLTRRNFDYIADLPVPGKPCNERQKYSLGKSNSQIL